MIEEPHSDPENIEKRDLKTGLFIKPQKIYIAARAAHGLEPVRDIYQRIEALGHTITFKWAEVDSVGKPYRENKSHSNNQLLAHQGLRGASEADVCILMDDPGLWGALIEWGAFLSNCEKFPDARLGYIVGAEGRHSVFDVLPHVRIVDSIDDVLNELDFLNTHD